MNNIFNIIADIYYYFICLRNSLYSKIVEPTNFKNIPIIINNRNRYTFLLQLINSLEQRGYSNIHILDNNSTYEPLLHYYKKTSHKVHYLGKNLGFKALEDSGLIKLFNKNFFVYTDPDVVPTEDCPENFLETFYNILLKYPKVQKVGFSLKIDDLPNYFEKKDDVIKWESSLYKKEIETNVFIAPIDTTFALHRPLARISTQGRFVNIRMAKPFEAYHMPWYNDSNNLNEEEKFYIQNVEIGTHWSTGAGYQNQSFFRRIFK